MNRYRRCTHTHEHGMPLSLRKRRDLATWDNVDGPWGYYAKWTQPDQERKIPYDCAHVWSVKNKKSVNKSNQTCRCRVLVARGEGVVGRIKWVKGISCMMTDGTLNFCGDIACYAVYRILSMWNINTVTSFKKKQETKDGSRQFSLLKVFET